MFRENNNQDQFVLLRESRQPHVTETRSFVNIKKKTRLFVISQMTHGNLTQLNEIDTLSAATKTRKEQRLLVKVGEMNV